MRDGQGFEMRRYVSALERNGHFKRPESDRKRGICASNASGNLQEPAERFKIKGMEEATIIHGGLA